jgi:hypothetical protein
MLYAGEATWPPNRRAGDAVAVRGETFVGKPCVHGHDGLRYTSGKKRCVECSREQHQKRWVNAEVRARQAEQNRIWHKNPVNRSRRSADRRERYALDIDYRSRVCATSRKRYKNPSVRSTRRAYVLNRLYGLSATDYNKMLHDQGGVCAICRGSPRGKHLSVDHCHNTGAVRGLLCGSCNSTIGKLKDDPMLTHLATKYLLERTPPQ